MPLIYVLISLVILFLTKKKLTQSLGNFIHSLGGNQHTAIVVWSIIFLPGTIVHEISHFLFAALTGARTGKIDIFPEYLESRSDDEGSVRVALGSVQTQKLNFIQGFLVGTAPFITGIALLIWLAALLQTSFSAGNTPLFLLEGYLFFTIANSFFPSWPDIKQTLPLIIILAILTILIWFFGFQISLSSSSFVWGILDSLWKAVAISILLNLALIGIIFILLRLTKRDP